MFVCKKRRVSFGETAGSFRVATGCLFFSEPPIDFVHILKKSLRLIKFKILLQIPVIHVFI